MTDSNRKTKTYVPRKGGSRVIEPDKGKSTSKDSKHKPEGGKDAG